MIHVEQTNLIAFLCGAASGLALFLSAPPVRCWPLTLAALLPWLAALQASPHFAAAGWAGAGLAVAFLVPLLRVLNLPYQLSLALGIWQGLIWLALSFGGHFFLHEHTPQGAVLFACLASVLAWVEFTVVPMFGTAQCFVRVLSAAPRLIQFAQVTGVTGIVWFLVAGQALLVQFARYREPKALLWLGVIWSLPLLFNEWSWRRPSLGKVRVAAAGWIEQPDPVTLIRGPYQRYLQRAEAEGAALLVSPETGFHFTDRAEWYRIFGALARQHNMALAVGFHDQQHGDNRIAFFDVQGEWRGDYRKTHLVPFFESYPRGRGERACAEVKGWRLGGVICQDDNFTDILRGYGRDGVQLLAIPTHDWRAVKDFHLENTILRAIETRTALVRGASGGISAIVSPRGELLRRLDHFQGGEGVIIAEVPVHDPVPTLYSRWGDWWVAVSAAALAVWLFWGARL